MITLFQFTVWHTLRQSKFRLTAGLLTFPAVIMLVARYATGGLTPDKTWETYHGVSLFVLLMALMPLVCMLHGTSLIGADAEQRTLVYLTTRKLRRATVLLVRFVAVWGLLTLLFGGAMLLLYLATVANLRLPAESGWQPRGELWIYLSITPLGVAAYLGLFTLLSLAFSRPLIVSMIYLAVFELILSNWPVPARKISISHPQRLTLVNKIENIDTLGSLDLPPFVRDTIYPPDATGTWTLVIVVAVLLALASILVSTRELVPAKVSRD